MGAGPPCMRDQSNTEGGWGARRDELLARLESRDLAEPTPLTRRDRASILAPSDFHPAGIRFIACTFLNRRVVGVLGTSEEPRTKNQW